MAAALAATQYTVLEWSFDSGKPYTDPFNEVELDVVFTGPGGEMRVPAFWAGGQSWRVRFAPPLPGRYAWRSVCSDTANPALHGREGVSEAAPYRGANPLLAHGPLRVSADGRCLEFADGEPFLWTGDTWWMSLTGRLHWPEDVRVLAADRLAKGFNVLQIIAGLYPDMPAYDERGCNEAGYAWEKDFARINPCWFDLADLKIAYLAGAGLMPCLVGAWAYFLPWMGVERLQRHWRYLVARWGAYPVVWCLAGEVAMPYYELILGATADKAKADEHRRMQAQGWSRIGQYVRSIDGHRRLITIHPSQASRDEIADPTVIDFEMLQTGHGGQWPLANILRRVPEQVARRPAMPVVNSEVNYEGLMEASALHVRVAYWSSMLGGCAGFTYGANGIWQVNEPGKPYGNSPWGGGYGDAPWTETFRYPGSMHVGIGARLLARYPWPKLECHPAWIESPASPEDPMGNYCAGVPGRLRIAYVPRGIVPWCRPKLLNLEQDVTWSIRYVNPQTGKEVPLPGSREQSEYVLPVAPVTHDWLVVMEAT